MTAAPWLVTGASGFLGRHLLHALQTPPGIRPVIALVRNPGEWHRMDWTRSLATVELLVGSVTEPEAWSGDRRLDDLGGIFHLAALVRHGRQHAVEVQHTNVKGTLAMVRVAAERRCRVLFVSSSGTVGCFRRPGETADEDAPYCENGEGIGRWPYYASKIKAEQQGRRLAAELGAELVIARPPVLLGPGDHRFRSTAHVLRFLQGRLPFLIRGGMHFTDVRDVAPALRRAMERHPVRPVYHLPGTVCTLEEFFGLVAAAAGRPAPRVILPFRPAWLLATLAERLGVAIRGRPFDLLPDPSVIEMASRHWSVRSRYAEGDLGYRSRPGRETVADTVSWLCANHPALSGTPAPDRGTRVTAAPV